MRRQLLSLLLLVPCALASSSSPSLGDHDVFTPQRIVEDHSTLSIEPPTILVTPAGREVLVYRRDHTSRGTTVVATVRRPHQRYWSPPVALTREGVVSYAVAARGRDRVTVAWRAVPPGSRVAVVRMRTLQPGRATWSKAELVASEPLRRREAALDGLVADVDARGRGVIAWPTEHGLHVVVRRPGTGWSDPAAFPHVAEAAWAGVDGSGGVGVVSTVIRAGDPAGLVLRHPAGGRWSRHCFVSCRGGTHPFTLTSVAGNANGRLAAAWSLPSRAGDQAQRVRVGIRRPDGRWTTTRLLARRATAGAVVDVDGAGRTSVVWQTRPPGEQRLHLAYRNAGGRWVWRRVLSRRTPSPAGDSVPVKVVSTRGTDLVVYKQVHAFRQVDQTRVVVRRCDVFRPCRPWHWVPTSSVLVDAAAGPDGEVSVAWGEGCAVVFENCYSKRVVASRLVAGRP